MPADLTAIRARLGGVPLDVLEMHAPDAQVPEYVLLLRRSNPVAEAVSERYAPLFAHAPADLRALCDEVERLRRHAEGMAAAWEADASAADVGDLMDAAVAAYRRDYPETP